MSSVSYLKTLVFPTHNNEIDLLINNQLEPHPKFTSALQTVFNSCARYYDSQGCFVNTQDQFNTIPAAAARHLLSLTQFRSLLSWLSGSTRRFADYSELRPLSWFELELFLEFQDSYRDMDLGYISSLSPYYQHSHSLQPHSDFDDIFDEDESTHNDPVHYAPCFIRWDSILCCSLEAFCKLFVDWSRRAPRTVWRLLFGFGFNGNLELDRTRSSQHKTLACKGLCVECHAAITNQLTRLTLICPACSFGKALDSDDILFAAC